MYKILSILGPPGSGKGTQSEFLQLNYNLIHISTGDIFREEILNSTSFGKKIKYFIDSGVLVPDNLVIDFISNKIIENNLNNGFLFDGFPRTKKQAIALIKELKILNLSLSNVISLEISNEILISRLLNRRICPNCKHVYNFNDNIKYCEIDKFKLVKRNDDNEETILIRLKEFEKEKLSLKRFYNEQNLLVEVDGSKKIMEVHDEIRNKLN